MKATILATLALVMGGSVAGAGLHPHSYTFDLVNTGSGGVTDARLRLHIDTLAVVGEEYFIDNVSLKCDGGPEIIDNGGFDAGLSPWGFFTNAPAPQPTADVVDGQAKITFGNDGTNTQLFQKDLQLPPEGVQCTLTFDACSTGGPDDPGYGHNLGLKLNKHTSPYTNFGLRLSGNPPNPQVDIRSCSEGPVCGDSVVDPDEECDSGGIDSEQCDADCTLPECGDGHVNSETQPTELCDDGNTTSGDGCDANCQPEPACDTVTCGAGTVLVGDECVTSISCGAGTVLVGDECVASISCGTGTGLDGSQCVPCPPNSITENNQCVACPEDTFAVDNECSPCPPGGQYEEGQCLHFAFFGYFGEAQVDLGNSTYTGTEKILLETLPPTGYTFCEHTWDVTDWEHSAQSGNPNPVTTPCTLPDGTPCTFWFTLVATNGMETGGDCAQVFGVPPGADGGNFTYGFHEDYTYQSYHFGPTLFYYNRTNSIWSPVAYNSPPLSGGPGGLVNLEDDGLFEYSWLQGYYYVTIPAP